MGVHADADGKVTAYVTLQATPPAVNWQYLMCQVKDTTTNELYQAQMLPVAGQPYHEVVISGLRPNRPHEAIAWAVNAFNLQGAPSPSLAFTTDNYTTAPSAPGGINAQQQSPRQVQVTWPIVTAAAGAPSIRRYVVFRRVGAGAFSEFARVDSNQWIDDNVSVGATYTYRVRAEDLLGNESADSTTATIVPAAIITDSLITAQGVSGASIANGSINRTRSTTSTGSGSGTVFGGSVVTVGTGGNPFTFHVNTGVTGAIPDICGLMGSPVNDQCVFNIRNNDPANQTWSINYRYVNP